MKIKPSILYASFVLMVIFVISPTTATAQQYFSVITGNVGAPYANIQVVDTKSGTSSDEKGDFYLKIPKIERQIGLLFSCIGYHDTLISFVPQQDTIKILFKMRETAYMLDAATITAEKITYYYSKPNFVMFDFEILDDNFFILQTKLGIKKDYRVLVTDLFYEPIDTIFLPKHIEPERIILDCMNNCQIVGHDSVYQLVKVDNNYAISFPSEKNYYETIMSNILFATDKYLYLKEITANGYLSLFYRINFESKEMETLFVNDETQKIAEIQAERIWHHNYKQNVPFYHGPDDDVWELTVKKISFLRKKDSHLAKTADTLYYFDHIDNKIQVYDENLKLLHISSITYPEKESFWRHTIYQDRVWGEFYTIFGTTLNEIDVKTGKTTPKINANNFFSKKMIIYKGNLYSLTKKRDYSNSEISCIEKTKLD